MDRQKIIKGLDLCSNALYCADPSSRCDQCTYKTKDMTGTDEINCSDVLMSDALALLKEQEAMNVDTFVQWCIDSHIMGDATVRGIKYWVGKFKEGR